MRKICIIGLGQIGGSLGLALKDANKSSGECYYIVGVDRKKSALDSALNIEAVDEVYTSLQAARDADIVVICTPVDTIAAIYRKLTKVVHETTVVTDTGSSKYNIEKQILSIYKEGRFIPFVGAHPMAGKEKSGILSADAKMFKNANIIITSSIKKSKNNEIVITRMWKDTGANVVRMSAKKHDELVAITSHIPHIIAFLLNKIYKRTRRTNIEIEKLVAGSFKSITRVAVSNAQMWAPIFSSNGKNIEKYLNYFIKELESFKQKLKYTQKVKKEIIKTQK